jgi:hypothetical protein
MPSVRYLRIRFANALRDYELPYFRSAVIEATARAHDRFHNHTEDAGSIYRYPLIQYKTVGGQAALVCLGDAVDDIHHLLQRPDLRLRIGAREDDFHIDDLRLHHYQVQVWDRMFAYRLHHWLPLNAQNYARFRDLPTEAAREAELTRILTGNLLNFAKGVGYWADQPVQVRIHRIRNSGFLKFKNHPHLGFDLDFSANMSLPPGVGVGKGAGVGYGVVEPRPNASDPNPDENFIASNQTQPLV